MLSSCCTSPENNTTHFTIPPKTTVVKVVWPVVDVPKELSLINKDILEYIAALQAQLKIQENNYIEFNKWRDKMLSEEEKLNK